MAVMHVDDIVLGDTDDCAETAATCVRIVAAAFGVKLKGTKSRGPTRALQALGAEFSLPAPGQKVATVELLPGKRIKYCKRFKHAIVAKRVSSTEAAKLAGVMQWAQSHCKVCNVDARRGSVHYIKIVILDMLVSTHTINTFE